MSNYQEPTIIRTDGTIRPFSFTGDAPDLQEMQTAVGGVIEPLYLSGEPARVMIMHEEGLHRKLPFNLKASVVAERNIVGDVIVMPRELLT